MNSGTAIIPNLDAIAEFRIVTSNFDAEYGEFSGGQISVVTKSGSNAFHGSAFDFLRNTDLDARNYFSPTRGAFRQNQFGGTFGGPIRRDKIFFFYRLPGHAADTGHRYGRDQRAVQRGPDRQPDRSSLVLRHQPWAGNKPTDRQPWAAHTLPVCLTQKLGYTVTQGEPYYFAGEQCPTSRGHACSALLRGMRVSRRADSEERVVGSGAADAPIYSGAEYRTAALRPRPSTKPCGDDKGGARLDANTRWGLLSGYYFIDDFNLDNPYPTAQSGASVPGFDALTTGRAQLLSLGDTQDHQLHRGE